MSTIIIKTHSATQTINQITEITKDGKPTIIEAQKFVNYELLDAELQKAPHHIITKRVKNDLHVSLEVEGVASDLIIKGFYDYDEQALIGQAEDGNYYYYIPDTAEVADYVTQLEAGDIEGQALGGPGQQNPWWIGAGDDAGFAILPWLVGLAGLGAAIAVLGKDDSDDKETAVIAIPKPGINAKEDGSVTVTPIDDATETEITYIDEEGQEQTVTFTKDPVTGEWVDNNPNDTLSVNPTTGEVTIPPNAVKDGSEVTANQTTPKGTSGPATVIAKDDIPEPTIIAQDDGSVTVTPIDDATETEITYIDEDGQEQIVTFTKDPSTGEWVDNNPNDTISVDSTTGEVTIPADAVKDGSAVTANQTTPKGTSGPATAIAKDDIPEPILEAPTIEFESTGDDDVYNSEEVGEDGTITATVKVPNSTQVGDTLIINGEVYLVSQDIIDDGQAVEVQPSDEVKASIQQYLKEIVKEATATAPAADTTVPDAPAINFEPTGDDDIYNSEEVGPDGTI
ncbi:MAG: hypothetical protein Q4P13_03225, partial [Psychrobacter sp.]|nr:hypothetical protein [Psychrobacter sp.]